MDVRAPSSRLGEAGFMLVEAVIALALVALVAGAALGAVAAVMHDSARALPEAALAASAQSVLVDLRAATAYDPAALTALAGRATTFDAAEIGPDGSTRRVHISVAVAPTAAGAAVATVTAADTAGHAATLSSTLVVEAPLPGSTVPADAPRPASTAGTIAL